MRISSTLGQAKEFGKELGEITGFSPTARRIAASIAPYTESEEDFANIVEELVGGVAKERKMGTLGKTLQELGANKNLAEGIDIAAAEQIAEIMRNKKVVAIACGTARHAAVIGKHILHKMPGQAVADRADLNTDPAHFTLF